MKRGKNAGVLRGVVLGLIALIAVVLIGWGLSKNNNTNSAKDADSSSKVSVNKNKPESATYPVVKDQTGKNINGLAKKYYKHLTQVTSTDVLQKISKKESFVLYVGRPTCPDCRLYLPIQTKVLNDLNKDILYLNTDAEKGNDARLNNLKKFMSQADVSVVPTIVKVSYKGNNAIFTQAPDEVYTELSGTGLRNFLK